MRIHELADIYDILTEAALKNKIMLRQNQQEDKPSDDIIDQANLKDDICLFQLKLVRTDTLRTINTISFINLPISKCQDQNHKILCEVLLKLNEPQGKSKEINFLPYNKSILTRIIYE